MRACLPRAPAVMPTTPSGPSSQRPVKSLPLSSEYDRTPLFVSPLTTTPSADRTRLALAPAMRPKHCRVPDPADPHMTVALGYSSEFATSPFMKAIQGFVQPDTGARGASNIQSPRLAPFEVK